jgi:ornithine cyclodeaminase
VVVRSRFFGDNEESVLQESGDFLIPLKEQAIDRAHFLGTVGQVLNGTLAGRTAKDEITVFEALGMAVEDIACAEYLYRNSTESSTVSG